MNNDEMKNVYVTDLIKHFTKDFDKHFWSSVKALEALLNPKDFESIKTELYKKKKFDAKYVEMFNVPADTFIKKKAEILGNWEAKNSEACDRGKTIHKFYENLGKSGTSSEITHLGLDIKSIKNNKDSEVRADSQGVFVESSINRVTPDNILKIIGKPDLAIIDGKDVHIIDYKSCEKISKSSYYDSGTKKRQMMKYPLSGVQDCNYYHAVLQLSLYGWLFKKINNDFIIKSLTIIHIDPKDKFTFYDVPFMEKEVERLLAFYKSEVIKEREYEKLKPIIY